jgi:hypothetical protein
LNNSTLLNFRKIGIIGRRKSPYQTSKIIFVL